MTKNSRLSFLRSRAIALRLSSLALSTLGAPSVNASVSPSVSAHSLSSPSLPSLPPVKSVHVWRKTGKAQDDASEALPSGFVPSPVSPFVPAVSPEMDAEIRAQAYADALPEIGFAHFSHLANCAPLLLTWRA